MRRRRPLRAVVTMGERLGELGHQFPHCDVLFSAELRSLLPADLPVQSLGEQRLKGWPELIAVYGLERKRGLRLLP